MRRVLSNALLVAAALAFAGCAVGNTHTFRYAPTQIEAVGQDRVVLLFKVREARPAVVDEGEPPSWVGEQRGGFGIPYNVLTTDGKAFTRVVQETLQKDLEAAGFDVEVSSTDAAETQAEIASRLGEASAERGLFVEVRDFNSNTYTNIDMEWDLLATVYGRSGAVLAENHLQGRTTLDGSFMNPPGAAKRSVPPFFYELTRDLVLRNDDVMRALTGQDEARPGASGETRCSVDQILSMRESGVTEEQIKAACEPGSGSS